MVAVMAEQKCPTCDADQVLEYEEVPQESFGQKA
jgi:hypothetical protein